MSEPLRPLYYHPSKMAEKSFDPNVDSLDVVLFTDEYGIEWTLMDTLESKNFTARFTRLKTMFLSVCKTKTEKRIGKLLFDGYTPREISEKLHLHYDSVTRSIRRLRKRCQEFQKQLNSQLKQL